MQLGSQWGPRPGEDHRNFPGKDSWARKEEQKHQQQEISTQDYMAMEILKSEKELMS